MQKIRLFLLLILCLAIPLQGFAAAVAFEPPCPMEMTSDGDTAAVSAMHDCCNDADTVAKTGKACKTGQKCPSGGQYLAFPPVMHSFTSSASDRLSLIAPFPHAFTPSGVWRPPTQF